MRAPFERTSDRDIPLGARPIDAPVDFHFGVEDGGSVEAKLAHVLHPQREVDLDGPERPAVFAVGPQKLSACTAARLLELSECVEADTCLAGRDAPGLTNRDRRSRNAEISLGGFPAELQLVGEDLGLLGLKGQAALVPNREMSVSLNDEQSLSASRQEPGPGPVRLDDALVTPPKFPAAHSLPKSRFAESGVGGLRIATGVEGLSVIARDA